jgi:hypothetical protein
MSSVLVTFGCLSDLCCHLVRPRLTGISLTATTNVHELLVTVMSKLWSLQFIVIGTHSGQIGALSVTMLGLSQMMVIVNRYNMRT